MKKLIYLTIVLFCFSITQIQAQWIAKEKGDMFGYVDPASGKTMIPYQYPFVYTDTLNTIAFVSVDHKIKAIDKNNNQLFTVFVYDSGPDYVEEGVFRIVDDETKKMGFANENGEIVIAPSYDFVLYFSDGLAAFNLGGEEVRDFDGHTTTVGGKWGYIDHQGNIVFPPIFDNAWAFNDHKADVSIGERSFTIELKKVNSE